MIHKYQKKPVIIEAVQFTSSPECFDSLLELGLDCDITLQDGKPVLKIPTLEGVMTASLNDYIIKGVQGEFYPCKPDIFHQTYLQVE